MRLKSFLIIGLATLVSVAVLVSLILILRTNPPTEVANPTNPTQTPQSISSPTSTTPPTAKPSPAATSTIPPTAQPSPTLAQTATSVPNPTPFPPSLFPAPSPLKSNVGLNIWLFEQAPEKIIEWLNDLEVRWVRHQLPWNEIEPKQGEYDWERLDKVVETLHQANIRILLNPVHSPEWACGCAVGMPTNPADLADFMGKVAQRYKGKVAAYEIWNEANLAQEAGKPLNPGRYVELLKASYKTIKAADPAALVVFGGLSPTGIKDPNFAWDDVDFLKQIYAYRNGEVKQYFDVLGAHPGNTLNPPDTLWPANPGPGPGWRDHPSFYFRRVEQIRQTMVDAGDAQKPVWITEFGWASTTKAAPGFAFAEQISEEQQARYIAHAFEIANTSYPWMGVMFLFQLNFALPEVTTDPADERIAWGILRRDGSKRPSYFAVQDAARGKN